MRRINGSDCASLMVDTLKKKYGFDVDEPLSTDEFFETFETLEEIG
jgi:hypothetical protein